MAGRSPRSHGPHRPCEKLALEADRLKFSLNDRQRRPMAGEDDALVADIRRLSELDALRESVAGRERR